MKGYGVNVHETTLVKVCLWHLLEQGILDLRHEHHIALHFPAQLHVDTRLAVSFTDVVINRKLNPKLY
jgi:hypothetical protein